MKNWLLVLGSMALLIVSLPEISRGETNEAGASFYIKGGGFVPKEKDLDLKFNAGDGVLTGEVGINWKLHRTFEIGASVLYNQYLTPGSLTARYRLDYMDDQIIVPFVAGGLDAYRLYKGWVFKPVTDRKMARIQYGYHFAGGVQILLDRFNPSQATIMSRQWGIEHTYLDLEIGNSVVNDFGRKRFDYGGGFYFFGLVFEY